MTEEQIKKDIKLHEMAITMLFDEYQGRLKLINKSLSGLKRLDDLVIFCQTGNYPS